VKRNLVVFTILATVLLVGLMTFFSGLPLTPISQAAIPTTFPTPRTPGDTGDICSLANGCIYQDGLAIQNKDVAQPNLYLETMANQTGSAIQVADTAGTTTFAVSPAGGILMAVGLESTAGGLTLDAGNINVTGNIHATVKVNSDATIGAGTIITAGTSASAPTLVGTTNVNSNGTIGAGTSITSGTSIIAGTSLAAGTSVVAGTSLAAGTSNTVGTFLVLTPAARITVTQNSTINPTGSYQPLGAAAGTSTATITIKPAGTLLRLINETTQTITISDTSTIMLTGDIALGQYDTLTLMSDGTNWVEIASSNN
jgi:hypothetical protein